MIFMVFSVFSIYNHTFPHRNIPKTLELPPVGELHGPQSPRWRRSGDPSCWECHRRGIREANPVADRGYHLETPRPLGKSWAVLLLAIVWSFFWAALFPSWNSGILLLVLRQFCKYFGVLIVIGFLVQRAKSVPLQAWKQSKHYALLCWEKATL